MKHILLYSFLTFAFLSCKDNKPNINSLGSKTEILAKSKEFINVNTDYFTDTVYTFKHKEIPNEDFIKIKAVIYRIYSNIDVKDNMYILNIKNGSEINISEDVFNIYKKNIEILNKEVNLLSTNITSSKEKISSTQKMKSISEGKVELPPVTKEYLNSLLKD